MADLGSLSIGEVGKELGRRWKNLAADEKQKYDDKSKENRERFCREMEDYKLRKEENKSTEPATGESPTNHQSESETAAPLDVQLLPAANPISDPEPSSSTNSSTDIFDTTHSKKPDPKIEDLGFAKQKGYSFHPAMKTGQIARGSRIQVTYFGTGQTGTVDASKWIKYSSCVEERIATPRLMKDSAFRVGLEQLKALSIKIAEGQEGTASSVISFHAQSGDRRLRKLSKDGLQREEEENSKLMKEKISPGIRALTSLAAEIVPGKANFHTKPEVMLGTVAQGGESTSRSQSQTSMTAVEKTATSPSPISSS